MSNEHLPHNIKENPLETNVCNRFQGAFRRALLDLDLLEYAVSKDALLRTTRNRHLVITCLDHVRNELRFTRRGRIVCCDNEKDFAGRIAAVLGVDSVYGSSSDDGEAMRKLL